MLPLPQGNDTATLIGIDPGTINLGVCLLTFHLRTYEVVRVRSTSYDGAKLPGSEWQSTTYGNRYRRIQAHRRNLVRIFQQEDPCLIASEAPFFNSRMPNAFEALTEVLCAVQEAVREYNPWLATLRASPSEVKNAIGAKGGAGKNPVKDALAKRPDICDKIEGTIDSLDEHAIDATGVALYALSYLKQLGLTAP